MLDRIQPPKFDDNSIPESEREAASALFLRLLEMDKHRRNFFAAVCLFESGIEALIDYNRKWHHDDREFIQLWKSIAARDGAMTAYHFHSTLESISSFAHDAPSLKPKINQSKIKEARKQFRSSFNRIEKLRNAVAHDADRGKNLRKIKENSTTTGAKSQNFSIGGPGMAVMLDSSLAGRTFSTMIEGEIFEYELSKETSGILLSVQKLVFSSFPSYP